MLRQLYHAHVLYWFLTIVIEVYSAGIVERGVVAVHPGRDGSDAEAQGSALVPATSLEIDSPV